MFLPTAIGIPITCGLALSVAVQRSSIAGSYSSLHPLCTGWGAVLSAVGIVCFRKKVSTPKINRWLHAGLLSVGALFIDYGMYVMWTVKSTMNRPHYKSLHSQLGVIVAMTMSLQAASSWVTNFPSEKASSENEGMRDCHRHLGHAISFLGACALSTGWWQGEILGKKALYRPLGVGVCLLITVVML